MQAEEDSALSNGARGGRLSCLAEWACCWSRAGLHPLSNRRPKRKGLIFINLATVFHGIHTAECCSFSLFPNLEGPCLGLIA
jgi:hypothetical protein